MLLAPIFQEKNLPSSDMFERHVGKLRNRIAAEPVHSERVVEAINLRDLFFSFTLDTATEFLFGQSTESLSNTEESKSDQQSTFVEAYNTSLRFLAKRERFKAFYWLVGGREFRKACKVARGSLEKIVHDSLDLLTQSNPEGHQRRFSPLRHVFQYAAGPKKATDELLNLLFAARDTSASLLCWIIYSLAREKVIFQTLRQEIIRILGEDTTRPPTNEELSQMFYLDQVITESEGFSSKSA